MKAFVRLFEDLDSTTSTLEKVAALKKYFRDAPPLDSLWAVLILTGRISKRVLTSRNLRELFLLKTAYPEWLYDESYHQVGDTAETLSLLAQTLHLTARQSQSSEESPEESLAEWMDRKIPNLAKIKDPHQKGEELLNWWSRLLPSEVFVLNKLMTGAFRVGVSEKLVIRGLAEVYNISTDQIAHRLAGNLEVSEEAFEKLISPLETEVAFSQPYPFCLAHAWNERSEKDWVPERWALEWKYDGIRSQVIKREGEVWIWSRGEELITDSFPDLAKMFISLPDGTVIDGEILVMRGGSIESFQNLQKRLGRKKVSVATMEEYPAGFMAYDCLEKNGQDLRQKSFRDRRQILEDLVTPFLGPQLKISEIFSAATLLELEELRLKSREKNAEGLMIKAWESPYTVGRKTGHWWKHKVDPLTLDAVLLYAQAGTGKRANLYTDYTFALWKGKELVTFAKAYSGLDQKEIDELDYWIRRHTKEKFGPVRSLEPFHVFEIAFEGISASSRHKSGVAVRFPRILRWRKDKKAEDADRLETAFKMLDGENSPVIPPEVSP